MKAPAAPVGRAAFPRVRARTRSTRIVCATTLVAFAAAGCATASKDIAANYVSPTAYQAYDCPQIAAEATRLQTRIVQLGGRLDQAASNDKAIVGVGVLLFWPVLFAVGGTKTQEAEFARLKGEYDALQQAAVEKRCTTSPGEGVAGAPSPGDATAAVPGATPSASTAPAAAATRRDTPFAVGDRLTYRLIDPVSGSTVAEQVMTIAQIDGEGVEYGDGDLRVDRSGTSVRGKFGPVRTVRIFPRTFASSGNWSGRIESYVDAADHADVTVTYEGPTTFAADGLQVGAQRVGFRGFTTPPRRATGVMSGTMPYALKGSAVFEPQSGVVLRLEVQTEHQLLAGTWTLVRRRGGG